MQTPEPVPYQGTSVPQSSIICLICLFFFLTKPGLCQEGVYQRPGDPGRAALLLQDFTRNARDVKLREKEHQLEDVTDTLKSFLSEAEDALLTKELYPYWVSALGLSAGTPELRDD